MSIVPYLDPVGTEDPEPRLFPALALQAPQMPAERSEKAKPSLAWISAVYEAEKAQARANNCAGRITISMIERRFGLKRSSLRCWREKNVR